MTHAGDVEVTRQWRLFQEHGCTHTAAALTRERADVARAPSGHVTAMRFLPHGALVEHLEASGGSRRIFDDESETVPSTAGFDSGEQPAPIDVRITIDGPRPRFGIARLQCVHVERGEKHLRNGG